MTYQVQMWVRGSGTWVDIGREYEREGCAWNYLDRRKPGPVRLRMRTHARWAFDEDHVLTKTQLVTEARGGDWEEEEIDEISPKELAKAVKRAITAAGRDIVAAVERAKNDEVLLLLEGLLAGLRGAP